jgi:hypothetical protein
MNSFSDFDEAGLAGFDVKWAGDNARKWKPNGKASDRLILSSAEFVSNYVAPEYMIDGIIQKRRIYSLTGKTGDGKTALQLYLSYLLATGSKLGHRQVESSRVLYLAGENPDDVQARWLAMGTNIGFDPHTIDVCFVAGQFRISSELDRLLNEARGFGDFGCAIVDTSAAFFEGEAENDNVQLGAHARLLRRLTELPGSPGVIVGCHPTKGGDLLLPRGGGSFVAEVDGNLTCRKISDEVVELHWCGKYRGPTFEPVPFQLRTITSTRVKDAKGKLIPSVMATAIDAAAVDNLQAAATADQEQVILALDSTPGLSQSALARALGWLDVHREPLKSKVNRTLQSLAAGGFAEQDLQQRYILTKRGKAEAERLRKITQ